MSIISIDKPLLVSSGLEVDSDEYVDYLNEIAAIYGVDEITERLALIENNSNTHLAGFTLIKYNYNWVFLSIYLNDGETSTSKDMGQIAEQEYNKKRNK